MYKEFDKFVASRRSDAPPGVTSITHSTWAWSWMRTQEGLVNGLFNGLAITFPVAFIVLFFATGNMVISAFGIGACPLSPPLPRGAVGTRERPRGFELFCSWRF